MLSIATLWIPFTITAALGQVARNAMQRQLTGPLGTWGATNIRFLFGFPFSLIFFAVVIAATGDAVPWPTAAFWPWLLLGALSQIVGTGMMLLAMEVIEHVTDVGTFLNRCAAMLKPGGLMLVSTINRTWKSFALAIVGAEYILRWLPRGTHQWDKFVTPDELAHHLHNNKLAITEQAGVVYSPFADRWSLSSDMDVNYMVVAEGV